MLANSAAPPCPPSPPCPAQHMLAHSGGAVFSRLHRLVTNPERRRAVSAMWRVLASKALTHERSKVSGGCWTVYLC